MSLTQFSKLIGSLSLREINLDHLELNDSLAIGVLLQLAGSPHLQSLSMRYNRLQGDLVQPHSKQGYTMPTLAHALGYLLCSRGSCSSRELVASERPPAEPRETTKVLDDLRWQMMQYHRRQQSRAAANRRLLEQRRASIAAQTSMAIVSSARIEPTPLPPEPSNTTVDRSISFQFATL